MASEPLFAVYPMSVTQRRHHGWSNALLDYWTLTKPEINFLIGLATASGFCVGCGASFGRFPWAYLVQTVLATVLVSSGAATLNQLIERQFDAQMRRTARRPLAVGRIKAVHAFVFGSMMSVVGCLYLALGVRPAASLLAAGTLLGYLFVYTPLKRRTPLCTLAGAFPGATPVLIGYVAAVGKLSSPAWILFGVLFLWQFPHFMAIAWMYRDDYVRAGYKILPQGEEQARFMEWQSVVPALALVFVAVVSMIVRHASPVASIGTLLLSVVFFCFAARLALVRSNVAARQLLLSSVVYLPVVFVLQVLAGS